MALIQTPGGFAPTIALGYGAIGDEVVACDPTHPLPVADRAFVGAQPMPLGAMMAPGRAIAVVCTVAGTLALRLPDDSVFSMPVEPGLSILPFAAVRAEIAGTTATVTLTVLR